METLTFKRYTADEQTRTKLGYIRTHAPYPRFDAKATIDAAGFEYDIPLEDVENIASFPFFCGSGAVG